MDKNKYENYGYSLIELLVVISVVSLLSSIALTMFNIFKERAADTLVKASMINSFKECKTSLFLEEEIPTFTLDLGLHSTNGYYQFYQEYDYKIRDNGTIPSTILGNCIGPLGPHRIGVKKVKGSKINGELSINLDSGEKLEKGGLSWN